MADENDNVIHVVFGAEGHRIVTRSEPPPARAKPAAEPLPQGDPLTELYTQAEVARLFGLTPGRLRYWAKTGFLAPSAKRGRRKLYTFQDLIGIRAAKGLLDAGLPLQQVRKSVDAIRAALPKVVRPLSELRVVAEGQAMLVRDEAATFEPRTGQLVLDFSVGSLREDVVRTLRPEPSPEEMRAAYEFYLEGCRLDEDPATFAEAEAAYLAALKLDPTLTNALTNLGNLRYRQGREAEAVALYRQALAIDPEQPEALYNLGFVHAENGEAAAAVPFFEAATRADPGFADAHFHLAAAYEATGQKAAAREHWSIYLELQPHGDWADLARERLGKR